ncbi:MAG TPA: 3D domain-containing protein [Thermotogota bacterium]|nr:3D domain-containing protein [Thermotogota bacterium]HPJ88418.1 3D domain-containing protein [Thermotogota bacterium]HPR95415.1 3D domain-containing protein [Thermotogota bacterium]
MKKHGVSILLTGIIIVLFFTSCVNPSQTEGVNGETIRIDSLETLLVSLQLRVEEVLSAIGQNSRDINRNSSELEALREAVNRNHDYIDTLYSSITYSGMLHSVPDISEVSEIPTIEQIQALIEVQNRKTMTEFEEKFSVIPVENPVADENPAVYDTSELDRLQKEIALLKDNFRTIRWQMYSEADQLMAEDQYPVYGKQVNYIIQSGDTLSQIADAFDLGSDGVEQIMRENGIDDPRTIRRGQELTITTRPIYESIVLPLYGRINIIPEDIRSFFGEKTSEGFSRGLVFKVDSGQQIVSCLAGKVIDVGSGYVVIYQGNDMKLVYTGIKTPLVSKGDWVSPNQIIGEAYEGQFTLEYILHSEYRDPMNLFLMKMGAFKITFYTEWEDGNLPFFPYFRRVKEGGFAKEWYSVAADPELFEKGTLLYIPELSNTPSRGLFVVQDEGSAIKGQRLDVYIRDLTVAKNLQTTATVYTFPTN